MKEYRITLTVINGTEESEAGATAVEVGDMIEVTTEALHTYHGQIVGIRVERTD